MKGFHCRQHLSSVKCLKKDQSQYLVCDQFIEYRLHLKLDRITLLTLKKHTKNSPVPFILGFSSVTEG